MANTLFTYIEGAIANGDGTTPDTSSTFSYPPMSSHQNVLHSVYRTVALDDGGQASIFIPAYSSAFWVCFMGRVVGEAKLTTVGVNWNGSSAVTGVTPGYGTANYPGFISMTTTKVTTFALEALADGTTVEYLLMILAEDDAL